MQCCQYANQQIRFQGVFPGIGLVKTRDSPLRFKICKLYCLKFITDKMKCVAVEKYPLFNVISTCRELSKNPYTSIGNMEHIPHEID